MPLSHTRGRRYCELPTEIFAGQIDVQMKPLPPIDLYTQNEHGEYELLRADHQPYSSLALRALPAIWVLEEDLEKLLTDPVVSASVPREKRAILLQRKAMVVVEDLFNEPSPENINRSARVVGSFVYTMMRDPKAYLLLSKLSSHDPYTLQHSVGTAVNCIILGKKVGITDEKELGELGLAGLLHDIGKVKVKVEIINKDGPLDELEWEEMRQHASEGYEIVKGNPTLSERTKRAILEHHEDRNGTGYPGKHKIQDLDLFSRIVSICDVYNALTTDRSYSKARTPFEAFQFMREKLAHKLDEDLFKALVRVYGGEI